MTALQEVIPLRRKAYASNSVNHVDVAKMVEGRDGLAVAAGIDVGKRKLFAVCRWADGRFERPWRVCNPSEIVDLAALLRRLGVGRKLIVAMESSGTYGDALRQALQDAEIEVHRVSTKARTTTQKFSMECRPSTTARTQRLWLSWRLWAKAFRGLFSRRRPGSRSWLTGWIGWWGIGKY